MDMSRIDCSQVVPCNPKSRCSFSPHVFPIRPLRPLRVLAMDGYPTAIIGGGLPEREPSSELGLVRDSLDADLQESGADLDGLKGGGLDDLDLLEEEFDLSHLRELGAGTVEGSGNESDFFNDMEASVQGGGSISREISLVFGGQGALSKETSAASAPQEKAQGAETLSHQ